MERTERMSAVRGGIFEVFKAILIAVIFNLAFVLLFAALLKVVTLSDGVIRIVNQVVKIASVLISCLLSAKSGKILLKCAVSGGLILLVSYLLFSALSCGPIELVSLLLETGLGIVVGIISGVITAIVRK